MTPNNYFIYKYEWKDGSVYIGQTSHDQDRFGHISEYKGYCPKVYNKMITDPDFTKVIVRDNLTVDVIDNYEIYYIRKYKSYYKVNPKGLNLTTGGQGIHTHRTSNEVRKRISESRIGKYTGKDNPFYGKKHSSLTIQKIVDKRSKPILQYDLDGNFIKKWKSATEAGNTLGIDRANIVSNLRQRKGGNACSSYGYIWKYYMPEYPTKIDVSYIETRYSHPHSETQFKSVIQYTPDMAIVRVWKSIKDIEKELGYDRHKIIDSCKCRRDTYHDYIWRYANE